VLISMTQAEFKPGSNLIRQELPQSHLHSLTGLEISSSTLSIPSQLDSKDKPILSNQGLLDLFLNPYAERVKVSIVE